jgi:pantoate--beta-alanine ligase
VQEAFGSQAAFTMEYFNVVDGFTLIDVKDWTSNDYIVGCIAVHLGGVRLIDNVVFKESAV